MMGDCPWSPDNGYQSNGKRRWRLYSSSLIAPSTMAKMTWAWSSARASARSGGLCFHSGAVLMGFVFPRLTFANDVYNPPLDLLSPPLRREYSWPTQPRWMGIVRVLRTRDTSTRTLRKTTGTESATRRSDKLVSIHSFPSSSPFFFFFFFFSSFSNQKPGMGYPPFRKDERGKGVGLVWRFTMRIEFHNRATRAQWDEIALQRGSGFIIYILVVVGFAPEEHVFPSSSRPKGIITLGRGATVWRQGEWKGWRKNGGDKGRGYR